MVANVVRAATLNSDVDIVNGIHRSIVSCESRYHTPVSPTRIAARQSDATAKTVRRSRRLARRAPATASRPQRARPPADRRLAGAAAIGGPRGRAIVGSFSRQRKMTRSRWIQVGHVVDGLRRRRSASAGSAHRASTRFERALAGEELVEHQPERVESSAVRQLAAASCSGAMYAGVPATLGADIVRRPPRGRSR